MAKLFHVYIDWTLDNPPQAFYIGKGDDGRVRSVKRNRKHGRVAAKHGIRRDVVLTTTDEQLAFELEIALIRGHITYAHDLHASSVACNFTLGGEGAVGRVANAETCRRISLAKKGKRPNKTWTQFERDQTSQRMSALHSGKTISAEHRQALKLIMNDPCNKERMRAKCAESWNELWATPEFRERIRSTRARGEKAGSAKLTERDVLEVRAAWQQVDAAVRGAQGRFCEEWASRLGVCGQNIRHIVKGKSWQHVLQAEAKQAA